MKLFLKEHYFLIAIQTLQFFVMLLVYWLDGYQNMRPALYAVFLGFFFLGGYLVYHYCTRRKFYQRLSQPIATLDESVQKIEQAPISEALEQLLKSQYKHYRHELKALELGQKEQLTFMEQWVHQMKTPLSVIELTAQNLDEPESSSIREETERIKTGLYTILYMARLRVIEEDFQVKAVNLTDMIHEVNQHNKRFYIRNKVYPKLELQDIFVESDEKWLFFMLSQLINNAVKYSSGKSQSIIISTYEKNAEAVLEVTDFGIGIPAQDQKRVFAPFFTGENGRQHRESTGMGLYVTKTAADYLGHRLELESEEGKGTTIRMIFTSTQNLTSM
ncbi:sensor histidine kinase [Bacillus sp. CLL-7-23]|uniref:histidine kinase n=1 Tax=Bacillus changyiensis TaxID=3004103 RepID=A0ABT4WYY7_9BACI|nr:sensor histidine kinase [Bacillus changyiensis]MDA7025148.1 sensor histidine kinase [Bacillus changyiensis]